MCEDDHGIGRRALFVTGAAAALTLGSVTFADGAHAEAADNQETRTVRGTLPPGSPDFVYLPVEVPAGVAEIKVSYTYERPSVPAGTAGNALDIGIFDEHGTELGGRGFRGWSGGARTEFFIRSDDATPGYVPGPVRPGRRSAPNVTRCGRPRPRPTTRNPRPPSSGVSGPARRPAP